MIPKFSLRVVRRGWDRAGIQGAPELLGVGAQRTRYDP